MYPHIVTYTKTLFTLEDMFAENSFEGIGEIHENVFLVNIIWYYTIYVLIHQCIQNIWYATLWQNIISKTILVVVLFAPSR